MGKKLIISGADFSANGIPVNSLGTLKAGTYLNSNGTFYAEGQNVTVSSTTAPVAGWKATEKIPAAAGKKWQLTVEAEVRYFIFAADGTFTTATLAAGTHEITHSVAGFLAINFRTANPSFPSVSWTVQDAAMLSRVTLY